MNPSGDLNEEADAFGAARECFAETVAWLGGVDATGLSHGDLEDALDARGRELLRRLLQDHLRLRARTEPRLAGVLDAEAVAHRRVETGHIRALASIFGPVQVDRLAYRHPGHANLHPADAVLNLPVERHSHGLRRLAAVEASRGSFAEASAGIDRATGQLLGKRQVEELAARAAGDVEDFYATRPRTTVDAEEVLVISADGKGIVMRPDSLRPATAKAAAASHSKLATRLSKGEKRNRKRLAEVGAVYDLTPVPRQPDDVLASSSTGDDGEGEGDRCAPPVPVAKNKWLTAGVVEDAAQVLARVFDQAERRDPDHRRTWVALVEGNNHQIDRITAEARDRGVQVTIVIDIIHVLEYLWAAAWCFFDEADPAAETWVHTKALAVLNGGARRVAASIRRRATATRLSKPRRRKADRAARYLVNKAAYLDYPTALTAGWPIASGVIEGACRHLVADRMDITGARWSTQGAETVLKLRALRANDDFEAYWRYHLKREQARIHSPCYANGIIPTAA